MRLAFERIKRGSNRDYKHYYRHLYPSYTLAQQELLKKLSHALRSGTYQPSDAEIVYQPKKSGVLRPITLLTLEDQIVYQALANRIAEKMSSTQERQALKRRFGALYNGRSSEFFFRPWKHAYAKYNDAIKGAFQSGKDWVAEFDLVSFYELIDHNLLRASLTSRVKDDALLDQLCTCLSRWTTNASGGHIRHGIPQGPEASAFFAECVLFPLDDIPLAGVTYLRYVDDVRVLGKDESAVRRCMLSLDLGAKDLGLVPQGHKLQVRRYTSLREVLKTIPSTLVAVRRSTAHVSQVELLRMWRKSMVRRKGSWEIDDVTRFKFALYRIKPRRDVLRRIATFMRSRPDLAPTLAQYFMQFPNDEEAALFLLSEVAVDPQYDAVAAAYIDALSVCEPSSNTREYRRAVRTAEKRSVEKSLTLRMATLRFRCMRTGVSDLIQMLLAETDANAVAAALASVCAGADGGPFTVKSLSPYLETLAAGQEASLARLAATLLLSDAAEAGEDWTPPKRMHSAVADLLVSVGLRTRGSSPPNAVGLYLEEAGVLPQINWKRALGTDFAEASRRAVRLRHLRVTEPSAFVLMLDTFNELLVHAFARAHPTLLPAFSAAAGANAHPDFGNWLSNGTFATAYPDLAVWLSAVHAMRLDADLAHLKHKKGPKMGKVTQIVTHQQAENLLAGARKPWTSLVSAWRKLL